jgi:hypothetical protein
MTYQTVCPKGHKNSFEDKGLDQVMGQELTLGVQNPEIQKENLKAAVQDVFIFCGECKKNYNLLECSKA